jgi:hypothetical protein
MPETSMYLVNRVSVHDSRRIIESAHRRQHATIFLLLHLLDLQKRPSCLEIVPSVSWGTIYLYSPRNLLGSGVPVLGLDLIT